MNWRGNVLGNFAEALLSALEPQGEPNGNPIGRVRAAVQAFQHHEDVLTQQMCHINVRGKVVANGRVDTETGDIESPVRMVEAIKLGILDAGTVESIQAFPTVCRNPNWTYWHQLKRFFAHYTRDADAPMRWRHKTLQFRMPPVLHPSVKRLLLR